MSNAPQSPERRDWLLYTLAGWIVATLGAIAFPVVRFLWPRPQTSTGAVSMVAPYKLRELKPDVDGRWPAPFDFGGKPCLLVLTPSGEVRAFNAICTHTDCTVEFRQDTGDIFCNCHNGVYNVDGQNVSGPPPRPLEAYKVVLQGKPGQEEIIVSQT